MPENFNDQDPQEVNRNLQKITKALGDASDNINKLSEAQLSEAGVDVPEVDLAAVSQAPVWTTETTPIQAEILPSTLSGKDASGRAQTGTGKTAAFLIAVITRMLNNPSGATGSRARHGS